MKRILLSLFALLTMQIVNASDDAVVCKGNSLEDVRNAVKGYVGYLVTGQSNLSLVNGYAGASYLVYWQDANGNLIDAPTSYRYEWSIVGDGQCYAWGSGKRCDVSVYHSGYGSARLVCDIYNGSTLVAAGVTYYLSYQ